MTTVGDHSHSLRRDGVWARRIAPVLAFAALYALLALPNQPGALTPRAFLIFPMELVLAAFVLAIAGRSNRLARPARIVVAIALLASLVVKLADFGLFAALNRPFNFAYDLPLVHAGWMVLLGSSGPLAASAYAAASAALFCAVGVLIWWATGVIGSIRPGRHVLAPLSLVVVAPLLWGAKPGGLPVSALTTRIVAEHVQAAFRAREDIATLAREEETDTFATAPAGTLLDALRGRDVIFAFVESYGRSSLDNPLYAATTRAALSDIETDLASHGLVARSAWLTSPTFGGQSWLAHSTLMSGLWIDSQGRYGALMNSSRKTLLRLAAENGWRSVGVMPAITQPWPEADFYGYSRVLAAGDLGYRGLPFNWVTMPDQYTWSAFERLELAPADRRPVFAEVALISSHAPWTPIPKLVPWDRIGDGSVFDDQARSGESPETVWSDRNLVRDQFRQSIDYALRTIGEFAVRRAAHPPLIVILGDHQPASFVSGTETDRDVPIHIIGDRETIARLDGWKWADGMVPAGTFPAWRMDRWRDRFLDAFSQSSKRPAEKEPFS